MQQITLIGTLGKDAELKTANSGRQFMVFSVAVNDGYGENKTTLWHDVVNFIPEGKTTKLIDYLTKGTMVYIRGKVSAKAYVNNAGAAIGTLSVIANDVVLLSSKEQKKQNQSSHESSGHIDYSQDAPDDLPFS